MPSVPGPGRYRAARLGGYLLRSAKSSASGELAGRGDSSRPWTRDWQVGKREKVVHRHEVGQDLGEMHRHGPPRSGRVSGDHGLGD